MLAAIATESAGCQAEIPDFRDVLQELVAAHARFLIVGAHALSAHGVPRATVDLDIWVWPDSENAQRCSRRSPVLALLSTRSESPRRTSSILTTSRSSASRRSALTSMTSVSGVDFDSAWEERVEGEIEGVLVPIIGRESFIKNKRASGRKKDLADLESLGIE